MKRSKVKIKATKIQATKFLGFYEEKRRKQKHVMHTNSMIQAVQYAIDNAGLKYQVQDLDEVNAIMEQMENLA